jgi:hypothetical protein
MKQAVRFPNIYVAVKVEDNAGQEQCDKNNAPYFNQHSKLQPFFYGKVKKPFSLETLF